MNLAKKLVGIKNKMVVIEDTEEISRQVRKELDSLFVLNPRYRREYNKLIKMLQIDGVYPRLHILRQGRATIYTFSIVVWIWLKYLLRNQGEEEVSLLEILNRIINKEEPFIGEEFYKNLKHLLEVTTN